MWPPYTRIDNPRYKYEHAYLQYFKKYIIGQFNKIFKILWNTRPYPHERIRAKHRSGYVKWISSANPIRILPMMMTATATATAMMVVEKTERKTFQSMNYLHRSDSNLLIRLRNRKLEHPIRKVELRLLGVVGIYPRGRKL